MNLYELFEAIPTVLDDPDGDQNKASTPQGKQYQGQLRAVHYLSKHKPLSPRMLEFAKKHFKNADANFEDVTVNEYNSEWYRAVFSQSTDPVLSTITSWNDLWNKVLSHYYVEKRNPTVVKEEELTERHEGVLRLIKQHFPNWPDYVIKDFVLGRIGKPNETYPVTKTEKTKAAILARRGEGNYEDLIQRVRDQKWAQSLLPHIEFLKEKYPVARWEKNNTLFTWDSWDSATQSKLAQMAGEDPRELADKIPRHLTRIGTQQATVQQYGRINEPIIVILHPRKSINDPLGGFELLEGHHRIVALIKTYGKLGFYAPAYIGHLR